LTNQKVGAVEPVIELAKPIAAAFHFDAAIDTEERNRNVAAEATARSATQRDALGRKAGIL
jgi:hypothetical protein